MRKQAVDKDRHTLHCLCSSTWIFPNPLCTVLPVGSTEALDTFGVGPLSRTCWGMRWGTGKWITQQGSWCERWVRRLTLLHLNLNLAPRISLVGFSTLLVRQWRKTHIYGALCWELSHRYSWSLITLRTLKASLVAQMVKNLPAMQETWIQSREDSPREGNGYPLQYSCLENPMDRGAWRATVYEVAKSQTRLSDQSIFLRTLRWRSHVTHSKTPHWQRQEPGGKPSLDWKVWPSRPPWIRLSYWPEKAMAKIPPMAASWWNLSRTWLDELCIVFLAKLRLKDPSCGTVFCGPSLQEERRSWMSCVIMPACSSWCISGLRWAKRHPCCLPGPKDFFPGILSSPFHLISATVWKLSEKSIQGSQVTVIQLWEFWEQNPTISCWFLEAPNRGIFKKYLCPEIQQFGKNCLGNCTSQLVIHILILKLTQETLTTV